MFGLFKRDKGRKRAAADGKRGARTGGQAASSAPPTLRMEGTPDPAAIDKARRALETGTARAKLRQTVKSAEDRDAAAAIRRMLHGDG